MEGANGDGCQKKHRARPVQVGPFYRDFPWPGTSPRAALPDRAAPAANGRAAWFAAIAGTPKVNAVGCKKVPSFEARFRYVSNISWLGLTRNEGAEIHARRTKGGRFWMHEMVPARLFRSCGFDAQHQLVAPRNRFWRPLLLIGVARQPCPFRPLRL